MIKKNGLEISTSPIEEYKEKNLIVHSSEIFLFLRNNIKPKEFKSLKIKFYCKVCNKDFFIPSRFKSRTCEVEFKFLCTKHARQNFYMKNYGVLNNSCLKQNKKRY